VIPVPPKKEKWANDLLVTQGAKSLIEYGESLKGTSPEVYNLTFGLAGEQVPVDKDLQQKIYFAATETQKYSFKIIRLKHPKYRFNAEPAEGTLGKQSVLEINLSLKMNCTTTMELEIPVLFWHGSLREYDKIISPDRPADKLVFVAYLRAKIQSQLSTRLDLEEVTLFKPSIGNGAFGTVYKGKYRGLDVAFKLLKDQEDLTKEMYDDFCGEVRMFETLRHPCIVNFVGAVFFPGSLALVTELCPYGSLPSAMKKYGHKVWNPAMKVKAMFDCARAMDFLHQSSIIHRDLKPDNLLATSLEIHSPAVCKLSDFGTTKGANSMLRDLKLTQGIGTPLYMAPEMMKGTGVYTMKADVYSFAILMGSIIDDGREPYEGNTSFNSLWQLANLVGDGMRPDVLNAGKMPPHLIDLMKRCWAGVPEDRPGFDQIATELETLLNEMVD